MVSKLDAMGSQFFYAPRDQSLYIEVRHTPWNDVVLARRTCEIIDHCPNSSEFNSLLPQAISFIKKSNFEYVQARVDHLRDKRHALEVAGFYYAELSYELSFRNPKAYSFDRDLSGRLELAPVQSPQEIDFIKAMVRDSFKHGRMLEDLNIDYIAAQQRTANWIDVLANAPHELLIAKHGDKLVGFHAQRLSVDGESLDWILTGTYSAYAMLSVPLWHTAFKLAQARDIKLIKTVISAANVGVLNLYNSFPFRVEKALCGYHLLIDV
ncbi:hypothetical protein [Aeromonas salmonicida]|uniref:hypothetical protein n=1 Tax=Aeromonas salmonicida TaxID=645 RepID=UPI000B07AC0E|nr:hypothetical protein [Aeromonas salmonicida]MDE7530956.1 hypothetical protein [Aeromonas salmonicida]